MNVLSHDDQQAIATVVASACLCPFMLIQTKKWGREELGTEPDIL
jgi:hypothetical protein